MCLVSHKRLLRSLGALSLALAMIGLVPGTAAASSLAIDWVGFDARSRVVSVSVDWPSGADWVNKTIRAGEMKWTWNPTVPAEFAEYDASFYSYCVDLHNTMVASDNVAIRSTNLLTVSGVPDAGGKAAWLFNTYASVVHAMPTGDYTQTLAAAESAAALQVAIWEALLDPSYNLTSGTFKLGTPNSASVIAKANTFLQGLYAGGLNSTTYNVSTASWLDTDDVQDQIYLPGVPEPGTLVLLATGLAGALVVRRRRQQKQSSP